MSDSEGFCVLITAILIWIIYHVIKSIYQKFRYWNNLRETQNETARTALSVYTITPRGNQMSTDPDYFDYSWDPVHRQSNKNDKDLPTYEEVMRMERGFANNRQTEIESPNIVDSSQNSSRV